MGIRPLRVPLYHDVQSDQLLPDNFTPVKPPIFGWPLCQHWEPLFCRAYDHNSLDYSHLLLWAVQLVLSVFPLLHDIVLKTTGAQVHGLETLTWRKQCRQGELPPSIHLLLPPILFRSISVHGRYCGAAAVHLCSISQYGPGVCLFHCDCLLETLCPSRQCA